MLTINIGAAPNDGTGDPLRTAGQKINANFAELVAVDTSHTNSIASLNDQATTFSAHASDTAKHVHAIGVSIGNGETTVDTGIAGYFVCPFDGQIDSVYMVANAGGNAVVDIWKASGVVPTVTNTICANNKPTLASAQFMSDTTITGWAKSAAVGDVFAFNVDSVTSIKQLTITLRIV